MGSVLNGDHYPTLNVVHNDPDGEMADTLRIWRGCSNSGGLWAEVIYQGLKNNVATYLDEYIVPGKEYYYFVDIKQADGQWIVTSPVWYKANSLVSVKENERKTAFNCFPNPASNNVSISVSEPDEYALIISDPAGRKVVNEKYSGMNFNIDLKGLDPGMYLLEVKSKKAFYSKRLLIQ
jgi:hypothetical protein